MLNNNRPKKTEAKTETPTHISEVVILLGVVVIALVAFAKTLPQIIELINTLITALMACVFSAFAVALIMYIQNENNVYSNYKSLGL